MTFGDFLRNGRFVIYSHFQLTMKVGLSIRLNCRPTLKNDLFFV